MKCDNCGQEANCLEEIWVYQEKRWGKEEIKKRVCPDCHEAIIQETFYENKTPNRELTINKDQRDFICDNFCNFKECQEECPLNDTDDQDFYLDNDDMEYLCSHCKLVGKVCDPNCPIREREVQKP